MSNGEPGDAGAQTKLAQVVAEANRPPEPSKWVQICQMAFAALLFVGALAIALVLVLHGPPAPKSADESGEGSGSTAAVGFTAQLRSPTVFTSEEDGQGKEEGGEENEEENEDNGEEGEGSLANLNEQAPWAFTIVALLVGAFLATGKTLNFSSTKGVVQQGEPDKEQPGGGAQP